MKTFGFIQVTISHHLKDPHPKTLEPDCLFPFARDCDTVSKGREYNGWRFLPCKGGNLFLSHDTLSEDYGLACLSRSLNCEGNLQRLPCIYPIDLWSFRALDDPAEVSDLPGVGILAVNLDSLFRKRELPPCLGRIPIEKSLHPGEGDHALCSVVDIAVLRAVIEEEVLTGVRFIPDISGGGVGEKNICHCAICQPEIDAHGVLHSELSRLIAHLRVQTSNVTADVTDIINLMDQVDTDRPASGLCPPGKGALKIVSGFV